MKKQGLSIFSLLLTGLFSLIFLTSFNSTDSHNNGKATTGGEMTFTVTTLPAGGNYSPKHVLAIWVEDVDGFIKTRKAMANQRKQYLYTWKAASNYNVVDAITGSTLNNHQTHTISWDFIDLEGNLVPDGEYTVWIEFTDKHAQGPLYHITFEKGPDAISLTPADEQYFVDIAFDYTPFVAEFSMNETEICEYGTVTFTDESINADSWEWEFGEGAAPATASGEGPHTVYYTTTGLKTVSLTINGSVTETKSEIISVLPTPVADFEYAGMGLTIDFTNTSTNATSYLWDFGDGSTSTENNPSHTYTDAGTYQVSLLANYGICENYISYEVSVPLVSTSEFQETVFSVFPNPTHGKINILFAQKPAANGVISVYNAQGQKIETIKLDQVKNNSFNINIAEHPKGVYFVSYKTETENQISKIVLE